MKETHLKQRIPLSKVTHSVRASQSVLQYGVGAMVDFPDQTLMTAAPEYWANSVDKIHDERLEKLLKVDYFGVPGNKDNYEYREGISYVRFPEWYFCPKCRKFQPISGWINEYQNKAQKKQLELDPFMVKNIRCYSCFQSLVVARIIVACEHGHIDDFPWVKWVHCQNIAGARSICDHPKLTFKTGASSVEGLEGLLVSCENCGAKASLKGAFDKNVFKELNEKYPGVYGFNCTGKHPWKNLQEDCSCYPRVLQRGSSSVYFPITVSSLVIPPYSNILNTKIEKSNSYSDCRIGVSTILKMPLPREIRDSYISKHIEECATQIALEIGSNIEAVRDVLSRKWYSSQEGEIGTIDVDYRAEEYAALCGEVSGSSLDDGDFYREATDINEYDVPFVKSISLIHKIREVQALIGFSRIRPVEINEDSKKQPNIVYVKERKTNWFPGYEVRGEGLFIEFDQSEIDNWQKGNVALEQRIELMNENYKESYVGSNNPRIITSKYVLLHTISHLLIKQLSFECGYNIASLKEKIYCSEADEGKEMAGILIYTASGDSEGTLGGLVRQGRSDVFSKMFMKAVNSALTCSNDPVCSLSNGQGRDSLNMAACYSCTLIPETSCEEFNILLDRGLVVGTFDDCKFGFYSNIIANDDHSVYREPQEKNTEDEMNKKKEKKIIVIKNCIDLQELSYLKIWENLIEWTYNATERGLLMELIKQSDDFVNHEKPLKSCEFIFTGSNESFFCDLMWKNSKVAFFMDENIEDYKRALESEWICFLASDPKMTVQKLLDSIVEKKLWQS